MKVKRKLPNEDIAWIVVEESPSYYLARHQYQTASSGLSMLSKSGYEPVPEVTWRDVTGRLEEGKDGGHQVFHDPHVWGYVLSVAANSPYRLRKICVNESEDSVFHEIKTAFIIERKEPA